MAHNPVITRASAMDFRIQTSASPGKLRITWESMTWSDWLSLPGYDGKAMEMASFFDRKSGSYKWPEIPVINDDQWHYMAMSMVII